MPSRAVRPTRLVRVAFSATVLLFVVHDRAAAERVQHTFTGVVTSVTDGTGGTVDLTGTFAIGQTFTLVTMIERETNGNVFTPGELFYLDAVTQWSLVIGPYTRVPGPAVNLSGIGLWNDVTGLNGEDYDRYELTIPQPYALPVNNAIPSWIVLNLADADATALVDDSLPREFPDIANFETATWRVDFHDSGLQLGGGIGGTLSGVSTPAAVTTWGRMKSQYHD